MTADDKGVWCDDCGCRMAAEVGRRFPGRREWLWWRCENCGAADGATPLPLRNGRPATTADSEDDPKVEPVLTLVAEPSIQ